MWRKEGYLQSKVDDYVKPIPSWSQICPFIAVKTLDHYLYERFHGDVPQYANVNPHLVGHN